MRTLLTFLLLLFIFAISFVLPNILFPPHVKIVEQKENNTFALLLVLLVDLSILIYLIQRLELWGIKLFLGVVIVFWGLQTFITQTETWYFRAAMPKITNDELRNFFLLPLLTSIIFAPLAIWILRKWKQDTKGSGYHGKASLNWKELLWLSVAYVVIYFVFGYFVAWQFEAVRIFYSGSPDKLGFIAQFKQTIHAKNSILLFQLLRGFLWVVIGLPMLLYSKGSKREIILMCVVLYAFLPAIQLILDNPFMPKQVRIAHLIETSMSNGLFGLLIGYASTRKRA